MKNYKLWLILLWLTKLRFFDSIPHIQQEFISRLTRIMIQICVILLWMTGHVQSKYILTVTLVTMSTPFQIHWTEAYFDQSSRELFQNCILKGFFQNFKCTFPKYWLTHIWSYFYRISRYRDTLSGLVWISHHNKKLLEIFWISEQSTSE